MKRSRIAGAVLALLVFSGGVGGSSAQGTELEKSKAPVKKTDKNRGVKPVDVALGKDGQLQGRVLDVQGAPVANQTVSVWRGEKQVASAMTDTEGAFEVAGLRGGLIAMNTKDAGGVYRVWAPNTAPPAASSKAMLYSGESVVRGQMYRLRSWIRNPLVAGTLIGGSVAVPLALHDREPNPQATIPPGS